MNGQNNLHHNPWYTISPGNNWNVDALRIKAKNERKEKPRPIYQKA